MNSIEIVYPGLLIHGDNEIAMRNLLPMYAEKFDLVYIDPPYNTNSNFYYSQERSAHISHANDDLLAYEDKMSFSDYLAFMKVRFELIHKLLSPCGSLYLHIDIRTGPYLRLMLDEIFGIDNFLNEITRIKSNPKNFKRKAYGNIKDIIYFYSKKRNNNIFNNLTSPLAPHDISKLFPKKDSFGRRYTTIPCHAPGETQKGATGSPWRGILPPAGRHWRCEPEELDRMDKAGLIEWSTNGVPRIRKYADEHKGSKIQDVWLNYKDAQYPIYPTEKNSDMLDMIVAQSSSPDSLVMDCFCGSGSFLAAAARQGRRFLGIDQSSVAINVASERVELIGSHSLQLVNRSCL